MSHAFRPPQPIFQVKTSTPVVCVFCARSRSKYGFDPGKSSSRFWAGVAVWLSARALSRGVAPLARLLTRRSRRGAINKIWGDYLRGCGMWPSVHAQCIYGLNEAKWRTLSASLLLLWSLAFLFSLLHIALFVLHFYSLSLSSLAHKQAERILRIMLFASRSGRQIYFDCRWWNQILRAHYPLRSLRRWKVGEQESLSEQAMCVSCCVFMYKPLSLSLFSAPSIMRRFTPLNCSNLTQMKSRTTRRKWFWFCRNWTADTK